MSLSLSPIEEQALSRLVNNTALWVAGALDISITDTKAFLETFCGFVEELNEAAGNRVFAFELCREAVASAGITLDVAHVLDGLNLGYECMCIDISLNVVLHPELVRADLDEVCDYSAKKHAVFIRVEGSEFRAIVNGIPKKPVDVYDPGLGESRTPKFSRPSRAYGRLIKDHYKYRLPTQIKDFWVNPAKRILIAERQTEKFFQKSLWDWLDQNVSDGRVIGEACKLSPERTDIEIQRHHGGSYIIEIKWLGMNSAKKSYDHRRIVEGVNQVREYLLRDEDVTKAILVCYDGRTKNEHAMNSAINEADKHTRGDYFVLYLPSAAASDQVGS